MFYDRFIELCQRKGVPPTRAAIEAGISKSLVSKWKANASKEPSPEVIRKLADYFEISPYEVIEAKSSDDDILPVESSELKNGTAFYDLYCELCKAKGITPTRAATEMGLSKSTPTAWKKKGITPQAAQLQKIADYFHVSVDYLCGNEEKPTSEDAELNEYLEMLRTRPEMKMMFQLAKGATKEDVEKAVRVIEAMFGKDTKGD